MQETDPAFGGLGPEVAWKASDEIRRGRDRIDHEPFGGARMGVFPLEIDRRGPRAPGLLTDLAQRLAIDRVGELSPEAFDVKLFNAAADFFIRRKGDRDGAMPDLAILSDQID